MIARFTQEDEYRGDGLNLYAYCDNNPVMYFDPSGYCKNDTKDPGEKIAKNSKTYTEDFYRTMSDKELKKLLDNRKLAKKQLKKELVKTEDY